MNKLKKREMWKLLYWRHNSIPEIRKFKTTFTEKEKTQIALISYWAEHFTIYTMIYLNKLENT